MLNILASFAEFEREMIAARIAETRARLKQRHLRFAGLWSGRMHSGGPSYSAAASADTPFFNRVFGYRVQRPTLSERFGDNRQTANRACSMKLNSEDRWAWQSKSRARGAIGQNFGHAAAVIYVAQR